MITKDIKIARLLKEFPEALEILISINPHFEKLRNKVLRKALAGRITLEQAASIGGVPLDLLLSELNSSAGSVRFCADEPEIEEKDSTVETDKPVFLTKISNDKISLFDVRPLIDAGQDPLSEILAKVKQVKKGEVLIIKNSFEPIPLYSVLEKKGFSHWTDKEENCFVVWFYKEKEMAFEPASAFDSSKKFDESNYDNIIEIDVHDLQPPEPMMKILENLNRVDEKSLMLVHHHREPVLLYPRLDERGYRAYCEKIGDENYKILIGKKE
jgi:uncharacterized protein (DUF2249 family)